MRKFEEFDRDEDSPENSYIIPKVSKLPFKCYVLLGLGVFFILLKVALHYLYVDLKTIQEEVTYIITESNLSIKVIVYIFPAFYPFAENDKQWGINFTEWDNVRRVTFNGYGLPSWKPSKEVGYYNLLDLDTRRRQGQFLRQNGVYGAVYHHYWFGYPVMDGVLKSLLRDGEPNIPFMLSWANEPWTTKWDGSDNSNVFLRQEYGNIKQWREHFDYLLPYFRHPLYIRSQNKVQFVIYEPLHMKDIAVPMFAAFRRWAIEEGLGGMDIIETRISGDPIDRPEADAYNEFGFRTVPSFDFTLVPSVERIGKVYHRGTFVCWDNTPRYQKFSWNNPFCHPSTWKYHLIEMFRRIKMDPNPVNSDNYFFINAFNEWGEGNVLEPSVQFGNSYGIALRSALEVSKKLDPWIYELKDEASKLKRDLTTSKTAPNLCILIRAFSQHPDNTPFNMASMLRSLLQQSNPNWRALVFKTELANYVDNLAETISKTFDPRIKLVDIPHEILAKYESEKFKGFETTDWVIENLDIIDPVCADAGYLLITDSDKTYDPSTFEAVGKNSTDIIGLNFASQDTFLKLEEGVKWNERCSRFNQLGTRVCEPSLLQNNNNNIQVGATFINLNKFRKSFNKFSNLSHTNPGTLIANLIKNHNWTWDQLLSTTCHFVHGYTYTACRSTSRFWIDSPDISEAGCYSYTDFQNRFKLDNLKEQWDLEYIRTDGFCLRYREDPYLQKIPRK